MSLFEDVKSKIFGEKMPEKPIMRITMLGARGVGKTSVLTSMYSNMNNAVNDTKLSLKKRHILLECVIYIYSTLSKSYRLILTE